MTKKISKGDVLCTLKGWKIIGDAEKAVGQRKARIEAAFTANKSRDNIQALLRLQRYYVQLREPEREGMEPRSLGDEFSGKLDGISIPKEPDKVCGLKMTFPKSDMINHALYLISECEPATIWLVQTQMELEFESGEDEDENPDQTTIE